ncbi:MAG: AAA family ATPase [Kiritimatiellia bacterium]|nr:AAA family ATPase [Kiritimatiellia bacterium]
MYIPYWNLTENPFQNVADPRFAFLSSQHREALARMLYLVDGRKLGGVLCGPYGVGKSMVLELLAEEIRRREGTRFLRMDAGPSGPMPVLRLILRRLGWTQPVEDVSQALFAFEELCSETRAAFSHLVLAIDEAQFFLSPEALSFLHLFTNLRVSRKDGSYGPPAATLLLSGPPMILDSITADPSLSQRLQIASILTALDEQQTLEYVHFRIRQAGGDIWMFDRAALEMLHRASGGIPRVINNLCDIAMVMGCAAQVHKIDAAMMDQTIADNLKLNPIAATESPV